MCHICVHYDQTLEICVPNWSSWLVDHSQFFFILIEPSPFAYHIGEMVIFFSFFNLFELKKSLDKSFEHSGHNDITIFVYWDWYVEVLRVWSYNIEVTLEDWPKDVA